MKHFTLINIQLYRSFFLFGILIMFQVLFWIFMPSDIAKKLTYSQSLVTVIAKGHIITSSLKRAF